MTDGEGRGGPPRRIRAWLGRRLPRGTVGASILADLDEEFGQRPRGSARRWWYRWEALRLAFAYGVIEPLRGDGRRGTNGYDGGGMNGMERIFGWVGRSVRRVRRDPGFTAVAVGTMVLGIGAAVSIFTVINAVLLQPLPYAEPDRLVTLTEADPAREVTGNVSNPGNLLDLEAGVGAFEELAGIVLAQSTLVRLDDRMNEFPAQYVTPDFFTLLGMEMAVGAGFSETASMAQPEILLAHDFWEQHFGADPTVVGQSLEVNGQAVTISGVVAPGYVVFQDEAAFYVSITMAETGDQTSTGRFLYGVARLAPGVSVEQARQEAQGVFAGLVEAYPDFNAGWEIEVRAIDDQILGDTRQGLWILLAAVGVLLLIACANVANLFLARATERRQEMAVRTSLGATGGVLARQLLGEAIVLSGLGGLLGVGAAWVGTRMIAARLPAAFALPRVEESGVDGPVLLFALAVSIGTGLLFAIVPALQLRREDPARTLGAEGRGPSRGTLRLRSGLIVLEVALSMPLLVGAILTTRSFVELIRADPGIETEGVLTARLNLVGRSSEERTRFYERMTADLQARDGVEAAGAITFLPLLSWGAATSFHDYDAPPASREDWPVADMRNVTGDYFAAMGIPLIAGRGFERGADVQGSPPVIVVNRATAESLWPGLDPIGRRLAINWGDLETPWVVVGVVDDVVQGAMDEETRPKVYHHYAQTAHFPWMHVAMRPIGAEVDLLPILEATVAEIDPTVPISQVIPMEDVVRDAIARPRMTAALMFVLAGLAALLAGVGLYGVLSWTVARRVREIGVRIAIGADGRRVLRMVLSQGMTLVGVGLVVGTGAAFVVGRTLQSLLTDLSTTDPVTVAAAALFFGAIALAACLVPAWRATRIPPSVAMREG